MIIMLYVLSSLAIITNFICAFVTVLLKDESESASQSASDCK